MLKWISNNLVKWIQWCVSLPLSEQNFQNYGDVDAYVIVYSITERSSFQHAVELLSQIYARDDQRRAAVILVANKSELVRSRQVGDDGEWKFLHTLFIFFICVCSIDEVLKKRVEKKMKKRKKKKESWYEAGAVHMFK